ncbi:helix-turn-helix domain-containing protein [Paenibacillus sp. GCM10027626]|uniref:helix-turn-helix domain-containing protein n=1 Tax=Paenibacillus sp. GCM10027626 TaxID=3273411 RepID=UPI00363E850F
MQITNKQLLESEDFPFYIDAVTIVPEEHVEDHSHEFIELAYVYAGTGSHRYNKGDYHTISSGDVFVIEPGMDHAYVGGRTENLIIYNVIFTPSLLKEELNMMAAFTSFLDFFYVEPLLRNDVRFQTRLTLYEHEQLEMKALLHRMLNEKQQKSLGYRIFIKTAMIQLFIFLSRCHQHKESQASPPPEKTMEHMLDFIHRHYAQPITLEQISRISGWSVSAFSAHFKRVTGQSFIEYRNDLRLAVAQSALADPAVKIAAIAGDVGFDDLSFFNKLFKKKYGCSPGQYRKQLQQSKS